MCAIPTPLPEVTGCRASKTVWRKTNECKHNKLQGRSSVVTGMKAAGMISVEGSRRKKRCARFIRHKTTLITSQGDGWIQGQMYNTCFARADGEIASIFECTDTAIKQTSVLGQLLRFLKSGVLDSTSSLSSLALGMHRKCAVVHAGNCKTSVWVHHSLLHGYSLGSSGMFPILTCPFTGTDGGASRCHSHPWCRGASM